MNLILPGAAAGPLGQDRLVFHERLAAGRALVVVELHDHDVGAVARRHHHDARLRRQVGLELLNLRGRGGRRASTGACVAATRGRRKRAGRGHGRARERHDRGGRGHDKRERRRDGRRRAKQSTKSRVARRGTLVMGYLVAAPDRRNSPMTATYVPTQSTQTALRMTNDA